MMNDKATADSAQGSEWGRSYRWLRKNSSPVYLQEKFVLEALGRPDQGRAQSFIDRAVLEQLAEAEPTDAGFEHWLLRCLTADDRFNLEKRNDASKGYKGTVPLAWGLMGKGGNGAPGRELFKLVLVRYPGCASILEQIFSEGTEDGLTSYLSRQGLMHDGPRRLPAAKLSQADNRENKLLIELPKAERFEDHLADFIYHNLIERSPNDPSPNRARRLVLAIGLATALAALQLTDGSVGYQAPRKVLICGGFGSSLPGQLKSLCAKGFEMVREDLTSSWRANPCSDHVFQPKKNKKDEFDEYKIPLSDSDFERWRADAAAQKRHSQELLKIFNNTLHANCLLHKGKKDAQHLRLDPLLLPVLVSGLVKKGESIPYPVFLERLAQLGLVVDEDDNRRPEHWKQLSSSPAKLDSLLEQNSRLLEDRLIAAGFAHRYSDGQTEVSDVR